MNIVIIKYNAGNTRSVEYALERCGVNCTISDDAENILNADKVIFPGVGQAKSAMKHLAEKGLDKVIPQLKQPVLGICLGMQLLCKHSEEGDTNCLNIFPMEVKKFIGDEKIPQMGWNSIFDLNGKLFSNIQKDSFMYFVHSYYVELSKFTSATCNYMQDYSAAIQKENFYAVQFHPEKSGDIGETILNNFLAL